MLGRPPEGSEEKHFAGKPVRHAPRPLLWLYIRWIGVLVLVAAGVRL